MVAATEEAGRVEEMVVVETVEEMEEVETVVAMVAVATAAVREVAARAAAKVVAAKVVAVAGTAVAQGAGRCRHRSFRSSPRSHIRYSLGRGPSGILGSSDGRPAADTGGASGAAGALTAVLGGQRETVGPTVCERTADRRSQCMARPIDRGATRCA